MPYESEVRISWRTPAVVSATVRDTRGLSDVRLAAHTWSCSCGAEMPCVHVELVREVVGEDAA